MNYIKCNYRISLDFDIQLTDKQVTMFVMAVGT